MATKKTAKDLIGDALSAATSNIMSGTSGAPAFMVGTALGSPVAGTAAMLGQQAANYAMSQIKNQVSQQQGGGGGFTQPTDTSAPAGGTVAGGRGGVSDTAAPQIPQPQQTTTVGTAGTTPTQISVDPSQYTWDTGAGILSPDSPMVRPVSYQNEFSPASTASMASDIYNRYYAPNVQTQQEKNIKEYQRGANRAIANVTSDRAATQLQNQATREAVEANTLYQQQQQLQAFKDTLDARQLELNNKIQDYSNAWQEVSTYGYVVSENTANLLGIEPGKQLTTLTYKNTMSNIAAQVAAAEAQKVQLAQAQANYQLDLEKFNESKRQFEMNYNISKQQADSASYSQLLDMLQRSDTVTPTIANLAAKLGIQMTVGTDTSQYYTSRERLENAQNVYGEGVTSIRDAETVSATTKALDNMANAVSANNSTGIVTDVGAFTQWLYGEIAKGRTLDNLIYQVDMNPQGLTGVKQSLITAVSIPRREALENIVRAAYNEYTKIASSRQGTSSMPSINRNYGI